VKILTVRNILPFNYACAVLMGLSACAPHSINTTPQTSIQPLEEFSVQSDIQNNQTFLTPWWESFERPVLNEFIAQALTQNYEIAQAYAVLNQAQSIARQTGAQRLPQIDARGDARGDASKNWEGSDGQRGSVEIGAELSWEIDIWGRIDAAAKADKLEAQARAQDVEALKLLLSAEVANAFFGAVASRERIRLLQEQLNLDKDLQGLLQLRLDNEVGTSVDVLRQKARVADSQTLIPLAEADLAVFENRLDVLLGETPDARSRVPNSETLKFTDDMPSIGIPASLLMNRPDLRAARVDLIAADADIGAAIADRLPRITLDGSYAFSDSASFNGPVSLIMGTFVQPLLDWGRRKAEVERNEALYEERLAAYTQLFLEAVEDVENALVRETKQREFLQRLKAQRDILQQTASASEDRYTEGIDDYLPVIDALQELRDVERDLIVEQLNLLNIRIALFRAIGGPLYASPNLNTAKDMSDETL
jgi:NodT family efflux transporter outer membrane factor (OMF) lipoprotein